MTIKHLSGNRVQGTEADRLLGENGVAGWREVMRISTANWNWQGARGLADYKYYMILSSSHGAYGANQIYFRINNLTSSPTEANGELKYTNSDMYDFGDGSDTQVGSSRHGILIGKHAGTTDEIFSVGFLSNPAGAEKLYTGSCVTSNQIGGYAPHGIEMAGKFIGTDKVHSIQFRRNNGTTDSATEDVKEGTQFVVLGWTDKLTATINDGHTDNFWKELSTTYGDGTTRVTSNKFKPYKFLWFQFMGRHTTGNGSTRVRFNYDEGSHYAKRTQINGTGTPADSVNQTSIDDGASQSQAEFMNGYICNIGGLDKTVIINGAKSDTAGANDIVRIETYGKWQGTGTQTASVNTHVPITSIQIDSSYAPFHADSILKVWGAN
jgi:hypothetical protein